MKQLGLFVILIFLFRASKAIECHECGSLSILPGGGDRDCASPYALDTMAKCSNYLIRRQGFAHSFQPSQIREVCYTLTGVFRDEKIVMRGCDAISSGHIGKCFGDELKVWFDTERGREYITAKNFCTCPSNRCNIF